MFSVNLITNNVRFDLRSMLGSYLGFTSTSKTYYTTTGKPHPFKKTEEDMIKLPHISLKIILVLINLNKQRIFSLDSRLEKSHWHRDRDNWHWHCWANVQIVRSARIASTMYNTVYHYPHFSEGLCEKW